MVGGRRVMYGGRGEVMCGRRGEVMCCGEGRYQGGRSVMLREYSRHIRALRMCSAACTATSSGI